MIIHVYLLKTHFSVFFFFCLILLVMIFHRSLLCFSSQELFSWNFGVKGFWDFSDPQIFPKKLMAIPSPQQNSADQAQFALNLKGIGNKNSLFYRHFHFCPRCI